MTYGPVGKVDRGWLYDDDTIAGMIFIFMLDYTN